MSDIKIVVSGPVNVHITPTVKDITTAANHVNKFAREKANETLNWVGRCLKYL